MAFKNAIFAFNGANFALISLFWCHQVAQNKPQEHHMHLARFPRRFIAHLPTPLERMDRLQKRTGRARNLDQTR